MPEPYKIKFIEVGPQLPMDFVYSQVIMTLADLLEVVDGLLTQIHKTAGVETALQNESICMPDEVRRFESELIKLALKLPGGHQARAARILGLNATTMNSKIMRCNLMNGDPSVVSKP